MEADPYHALGEALGAVIRKEIRAALAEVASTTGDSAALLSVPKGAALLGIGKTKLYQLIASGELPSVVVGKRRLLRPADLEQFSASHGNGH
jgi:excisionase family DNA binding protein